MCDVPHSAVELRFEHLAKRGIENGLWERGDMIRDAFPKKEHGKIVGEVVTIMKKQIV